MNRRDALKVASIAIATAAVSANATEIAATKPPMNRMDMKPQDPSKPNNFELKHMPEIIVKGKDDKGYAMVEIIIGQNGMIHPSTPDHWIDFIELYADDKLVGRNVLEADISRGATAFAVKLEGVKKLTSKAGCNLHGIWTASVDL